MLKFFILSLSLSSLANASDKFDDTLYQMPDRNKLYNIVKAQVGSDYEYVTNYLARSLGGEEVLLVGILLQTNEAFNSSTKELMQLCDAYDELFSDKGLSLDERKSLLSKISNKNDNQIEDSSQKLKYDIDSLKEKIIRAIFQDNPQALEKYEYYLKHIKKN